MAVSVDFSRPKVAQALTWAVPLTLKAAEVSGTPTTLSGSASGLTGIADLRYEADLDISGTNVVQLAKITVTPAIDSGTGTISWAVVLTPKIFSGGSGTDAATAAAGIITATFTHPQRMDALMSGAGQVSYN